MAEGLKSGFLVKKGRSSHKWKTRWFVLHETSLCYHRKADRYSPIGCIQLQGACVVSPVKGYDKRQGVFKLSTKYGREYLLRAPTDEERDVWTHALGAVIRQLEGMIQNESSSATKELSSRVNLSDVLGAMQDPDAGVLMTKCTIDGTEYENCFSGCAVVDWLLRWSFVTTREDAVSLADDLIRLAHVQQMSAINEKEASKGKFVDSNDEYYRFSAWTRLENPDFILDSSTEDSSSSAGEFSEGDILDNNKEKKQEKVVKEGFLLKRGHLRKKWKARKIILKDNPAVIEYYAASKDTDPLKTISIEDAIVLDSADSSSYPNDNIPSLPKKRQHVFCVKLSVDKVLVFQAENEHLKGEWIKALSKVCHSSKKKTGERK